MLVIAVSAAVIFKNTIDGDEYVNTVPTPPASQIYDAIRELTTEQFSDYGLAIALLVPGASITENTWDFRGNARTSERDKPFFGTIRNICLEFGDIACWRLSLLNLDGVALPLTSDASLDETINQAANIASGQSEPLQSEIQPQAKPQKPQAKPETKPELQIWRTRTNNVNGRMGPGTEFKIAFKIPDSINLGLIEKRDGWGLFRYDAEGGKEGKIWVSMRLVLPR
jgi:hypothetical protein